MKALYSTGSSVPFSRVLREHRVALVPLGILLAINVLVLVGVVLPLSRRAQANEARAASAEQALQAAEAEYRQAEGLREGKARATSELDIFYQQVLPTDFTTARRIMHTKLQQIALTHGLRYERGVTQIEDIRDSSLERMQSTFQLTGDYDDVRAFIYDLETESDFVVIDNLVLAEGTQTNAPLAFSLELSTYYRKPGAGLPSRTGAN